MGIAMQAKFVTSIANFGELLWEGFEGVSWSEELVDILAEATMEIGVRMTDGSFDVVLVVKL